MRLSNNKVLITGATDGIGKALAKKFLSLGNTVIAVGRNEERLMQLQAQHEGLISFQCDVSKLEDLEALSMFIESSHRDLNILINNAGIQYNYGFSDEIHLLNKIDHEVAVNYLGPLRLTALLLPTLRLNDNAAVVNVSSALGIVPKMQAPVYCGTKAGLHIFSKALRYQLEHVKVFEIIPPLVDTNMTAGRGRGKISPERLADVFVKSFSKDIYEVNVGKTKLLRLLNRISPDLAERIMKNGR